MEFRWVFGIKFVGFFCRQMNETNESGAQRERERDLAKIIHRARRVASSNANSPFESGLFEAWLSPRVGHQRANAENRQGWKKKMELFFHAFLTFWLWIRALLYRKLSSAQQKLQSVSACRGPSKEECSDAKEVKSLYSTRSSRRLFDINRINVLLKNPPWLN